MKWRLAAAVSATYGVSSASASAGMAGQPGHQLVGEDRVEGGAEVGGARRRVVHHLDAEVRERRGRAPDGVPARAAHGLQAVLLEDGDARAPARPPVAARRARRARARGRPRSGPSARPCRTSGSPPRAAGRDAAGRASRPARCAARRRRSSGRARGSSRSGPSRSRAGTWPPRGRRPRRRTTRPPCGSGRAGCGGAVDAVDGVPERAELRQVRLAEQDRAGAPHAADQLGVLRGRRRREEAGAVARRAGPRRR